MITLQKGSSCEQGDDRCLVKWRFTRDRLIHVGREPVCAQKGRYPQSPQEAEDVHRGG